MQGTVRNGALEFRGIPFAAAPVGELRWAPPQPVEPWEGVLDATEFGPACPQVARYNLTEASDEEDCLHLAVSIPADFDPASGEKLPVIVWIHGGAYVGGANSLYRLDKLAREGRVVVVAPNYRIGALGWMPHAAFDPDTNGGYGLLDQRAALQWVQRNIAAFGGDPNNVTIAGESAGAGSICHHLVTPDDSEGLFHKAIIVSGGCLRPMPTVEQLFPTGQQFSEMVGCAEAASELDCLRQVPLEKILEVQTELAGSTLMAYGPTVGTVVPQSVRDALTAGRIMRVPIMMGGATNELRLYVAYEVQAGWPVTEDNYRERLEITYGSSALEQERGIPDKVALQYPLRQGDVPAERYGSLISDFTPIIGINNCLFLATADAFSWFNPVYEFEFSDEDALVLGVGVPAEPDPGFRLGAVHSAILNYVFPNYSNTSRIDAPDLPPASQERAEQIVAYWASFARNGVPTLDGVAEWPLYAGGATVQRLAPGNIGPFDASAFHQCTFWADLYPERL